jgi:hypothetical protein
MRGLRALIVIAYLVIGVVIAVNRNYLESLDTPREIISAILAIALWPLILLGINLRIKG